MALPKIASGTKLKILLGDGAEPTEVFSSPCGLTDTSLNLSADANDFDIPDCADPDAPAFKTREIQSISGEISGSGILATDTLATWRTWFFAGTPKNVRVMLDVPAGDGGGHFALSARLTSLNIKGQRGNKTEVDVSIVSDGEIVWGAAS